MTAPTVPPTTRVFTFGGGHACPFTGKGLGDHYVTVVAPDASSARTVMNATFGRAWASEYAGPHDPRIADYLPGMTEHARIELAPPADDGFGYSRDAEPDNPAPVSPARVPLRAGSVVDGDELVGDGRL